MPLLTHAYDAMEVLWNRGATHRRLVDLLLITFLVSLGVIEAKRWDLLPSPIAERVPVSHFVAIYVTFELLLYVEAVGLVFGLSSSVANTVGKQFEILGLILIRQTFEEFVHFDEPIGWADVSHSIGPVIWDGLGGLAIFGLLGLYYRVQKHHPIPKGQFDQTSFIQAKKWVALVVLVGFGAIITQGVRAWIGQTEEVDVFGAFYTLLIFSDVLLVLISMRYTTQYRIIFRNFGFALATVLIRLALVAPPGANALLGVGGLLYALAVSILYDLYGEPKDVPHTDSPTNPPSGWDGMAGFGRSSQLAAAAVPVDPLDWTQTMTDLSRAQKVDLL